MQNWPQILDLVTWVPKYHIWEPTSSNPKFEANRTSGMVDMAPQNVRISAKMGTVANL